MFEESKLLGISMTPRSHRRALVVVAYAATALVMWAVLAVPFFLRPRGWYNILAGMIVFSSIWLVLLLIVGRGVFGRFVRSGFRQFVGPPPRPVQTGLGLAATAPEDEPATDEREAALRDHAYRLAYKGLAVGTSLFLFPGLGVAMAVASLRIALAAATLAMCLFVIVALTLPQAVILWIEPDLVEQEENAMIG